MSKRENKKWFPPVLPDANNLSLPYRFGQIYQIQVVRLHLVDSQEVFSIGSKSVTPANQGKLVWEPVSLDYIYDHFRANVVDELRQCAYDNRDALTHSGSTNYNSDVDVAQHGIEIELTERPIVRIKYNTEDNRFTGYSLDDDGNPHYVYDLESSGWLQKSGLSEEYLSLVKSGAMAGWEKFIRLPVGRATRHSKVKAAHDVDATAIPSVVYQQGPYPSCVPSCLASALHFVGLESEAAVIENWKRERLATGDTHEFTVGPGKVWDSIQKIGGVRNFRREWQLLKWNAKDLVFAGRDKLEILWLVLQSINGDSSHCIAIADRWIFDSNRPKALPLSKDSLDVCCQGSPFHRVAMGFVICKQEHKCHLRGKKDPVAAPQNKLPVVPDKWN